VLINNYSGCFNCTHFALCFILDLKVTSTYKLLLIFRNLIVTAWLLGSILGAIPLHYWQKTRIRSHKASYCSRLYSFLPRHHTHLLVFYHLPQAFLTGLLLGLRLPGFWSTLLNFYFSTFFSDQMMTMILARSSDSLYLQRVMLTDTSDSLRSVKRSSLSL